MDTESALRLTYGGAERLLAAAVEAAHAIGVPQCIAVVDTGGHLLAFARMDGGRFTSIDTAMRKAVTAAATRRPSGQWDESLGTRLGIATGGVMTNLKGGLPIEIDGQVVGGIGVGSGTGDQDLAVATRALEAFRAAAGA